MFVQNLFHRNSKIKSISPGFIPLKFFWLFVTLFQSSGWWRGRSIPGWQRSCPGSRDTSPAGSCRPPRWWSSRCRGKLLGRWRRSDRGSLPDWWVSRWRRRERWCPEGKWSEWRLNKKKIRIFFPLVCKIFKARYKNWDQPGNPQTHNSCVLFQAPPPSQFEYWHRKWRHAQVT